MLVAILHIVTCSNHIAMKLLIGIGGGGGGAMASWAPSPPGAAYDLWHHSFIATFRLLPVVTGASVVKEMSLKNN